MKMKCSYHECQEDWNDDDPKCLCGEPDYRKCKNFILEEGEAGLGPVAEKENIDLSVLWNGSAMGSIDIELLSSRKQPLVIGVIGHAKSGKTTLLATLYMLLRSGKHIGDYQFAGSYTLLGWEKIAHFLTLNAHKKVSFPPHTSANMTRVPGLLHIFLKDKFDRFHDVLFTDAPGEWFSDWAKSSEAETSTGARWIDDQADAFILVADTQAFKENIGKARHDLMQIVERMKNTHEQRPVSLVWTKADIDLSTEIKTRITTNVTTILPGVQSYDVAVINRKSEEDVENILNLTAYLLTQKHHHQNKLPQFETKSREDLFFLINKP